MKLATVEKKTFLAGLQCTLTSSCAIIIIIKLVENKTPNATRRKQLAENKGRKTGRKLTRRIITIYNEGLSSANCINYGSFFDSVSRIKSLF